VAALLTFILNAIFKSIVYLLPMVSARNLILYMSVLTTENISKECSRTVFLRIINFGKINSSPGALGSGLKVLLEGLTEASEIGVKLGEVSYDSGDCVLSLAEFVQVERVDKTGNCEVSNGDLVSNDEVLGGVSKKSLANGCEPLREGGAEVGLEELWLGSLISESGLIERIHDVSKGIDG
jgi:hypothetical protein